MAEPAGCCWRFSRCRCGDGGRVKPRPAENRLSGGTRAGAAGPDLGAETDGVGAAAVVGFEDAVHDDKRVAGGGGGAGAGAAPEEIVDDRLDERLRDVGRWIERELLEAAGGFEADGLVLLSLQKGEFGQIWNPRAKFVRFVLRRAIRVRGVILMHRTARTLNPMLTERVRTTERVGFRRGAIHDKVLQIERENLSLFFRLRRVTRPADFRGG